MSGKANKLSLFWQELKRRKVVRVITVYAASAFVILELTDIVAPSLGLPEWTLNFIIILLCVGFIISVLLSWIYDIHPEEGIVKTEADDAIKTKESTKRTNVWKIATYTSVVIIVGLLAFNIFKGKRDIKIDESLRKSIAVLPFHNYSGDSDEDYMCEGLTDEIISHLFKVRSFDEVRSLTSVLPFKDSEQSINEIAQKLQVTYILEGSYKRMGEELKITAQLIESKNDKHIWLKDYELPYTEIPGIPGEIAMQIANHLKAFVSEEVQSSIGQVPTENIEAYELMQQAIRLHNSGLFSNRFQVRDLAERAIELDPDYANAYAIIGMSHLMEGIYWGDKEMRSVAWEADRYTAKALEIDPCNLMAKVVISCINFWVKWDYAEVFKIRSKFPNISESELFNKYAEQEFYLQMGEYETVVNLLKENYYFSNAIRTYVLLGDTAKAKNMLKEMISERGSKEYLRAGELFIWFEEYDSARYYLEAAMQIPNNTRIFTPRHQANLALACYKCGAPEHARKIINQLIRKNDTTAAGSPAFHTGWYYSAIGEIDSAFYWLENSYQNRSPEMPWLKVDPAFSSLKNDSRYWDLYNRTGHKAYDEYKANSNK